MATAKKTAVKKVSAKRISRTNVTEAQYVNRPSQITRAAPTKRAKTRRQTHLDSGLPVGYYPNPVKPKSMFPLEWAIEIENHANGSFDCIALVNLKGTAEVMARAWADATGWPLRLRRVN